MKTWKDVVNNTFYVGDQQAPWDTEVIEIDDWKQVRKQYISERRYFTEISGVFDNAGHKLYDSDRVSQSRIAQVSKLIDIDPTMTELQWKSTDGTWQLLSKAEVSSMAIAVGQHVQQCYNTEYLLHQQIDQASTIEQVLQVDWK